MDQQAAHGTWQVVKQTTQKVTCIADSHMAYSDPSFQMHWTYIYIYHIVYLGLQKEGMALQVSRTSTRPRWALPAHLWNLGERMCRAVPAAKPWAIS